ncbi:MAG: hypothetical protein K6E55_07165 [Thermoguttaceae bacterium]|nr:hypothetical protein [Thermoguttaceae bacterium]
MNQEGTFTPVGAFGFGGYPSAEVIALQDWAERIFRLGPAPHRSDHGKKGVNADGTDCVYHVRTDRLGIRDAMGGR